MKLFELILLAFGLSMDALAVTFSNCLTYTQGKWKMPVFFGVFQGLMPVLGYFAGTFFASFIQKYAGIITLIILGYIGVKMIIDGFKYENEEKPEQELTYGTVVAQAIATSIDAFAVGISFLALDVKIVLSSVIIAVTTFVICTAGLFLGVRVAATMGKKAQLLGGAILIVIGIKAML